MDVTIVDEPDVRRYAAYLEGELAGFAEYVPATGRLIFTHTVVTAAFEGRGIGSALAGGALDDARARGLRVTPRCRFIAAHIRRHPEYLDLVTDPALVAERDPPAA